MEGRGEAVNDRRQTASASEHQTLFGGVLYAGGAAAASNKARCHQPWAVEHRARGREGMAKARRDDLGTVMAQVESSTVRVEVVIAYIYLYLLRCVWGWGSYIRRCLFLDFAGPAKIQLLKNGLPLFCLSFDIFFFIYFSRVYL